jgi:hypothetical protein
VWTAREALLSGTLVRSNPNRELVNRKLPSGSRRHNRKRIRQLTRASKGRHGAFAYPCQPDRGLEQSRKTEERITDVEAGWR